MAFQQGSINLYYANSTTKSGDTVTGTTSETIFASKALIKANTLQVGQVVTIWGRGRYTCGVISTTVAKIKFGTVALLTTPTLANAVGVTNYPYSFIASGIVQSIGSTGKVEVQGSLTFNTAIGSSIMVEVGNGNPIQIDTTVDTYLQASCTLSSTTVSNTLTQFSVWLTNPPTTTD